MVRRVISIVDWYGRAATLIQLAILFTALLGGGLGGSVVNAGHGALLGVSTAAILILILYVLGQVFDRVFPFPCFRATPREINGESGYGRAIAGYLTTAWVSVILQANNPGRWDECRIRRKSDPLSTVKLTPQGGFLC